MSKNAFRFYNDQFLEVDLGSCKRIFKVDEPIWVTYVDKEFITGFAYKKGTFQGFEMVGDEMSLILIVEGWGNMKYPVNHCSNSIKELADQNGDKGIKITCSIG